MIKKIFGYIFIILASLLILSFTGNFEKFLGEVLAFFRIFIEETTKAEAGYAIGSIILWVVYIAIVIVLFRVGLKWIKSHRKVIDRGGLPLDSDLK